MFIFKVRVCAVLLCYALASSTTGGVAVARAADLLTKIQEIEEEAKKSLDASVRAKLAALVVMADCAKEKERLECYEKSIDETLNSVLSLETKEDDKKKLQDSVLKYILKSKVLVESDLRTALLAAADPKPAAVIHIVAAFYGHLDDIAYELKHFQPRSFTELADRSYVSDRFCSATRAVRTQCQGKKLCFGATFTATSLCGFDPAPYAESRVKGLLVRYRCSTEKPDPDGVRDQDNIIPDKFTTDIKPGTDVLRWALLRSSETAAIICTPTDQSAAGGAANAKPSGE